MPNFYSLNITNSGSIRLFNTHDDFVNNTGFVTSVTNKGLEFSKFAGQSTTQILQLSSSNREPRVGIGFQSGEKFSSTFDLLSTTDSAVGTEIILRSARTAIGAQPGDIAGKINFAIQSASYKSTELSGSAASIRSRVDQIDDTGVIGSLILATPASKYAEQDTLTLSFLGSTFSSSLTVLSDINSTATVTTNYLTASRGAYISGALYLNGPTVLVDPPPGNQSFGIEFHQTFSPAGGQVIADVTDGRWTARRLDGSGPSYNGVDPDLFSIALTGSFYHSGSYVVNGSTVNMQNTIFTLGGFEDVSSSLATIDAGVF